MSLTNAFMNIMTSFILETQMKILHWLTEVFIIYGKILNLHIISINLKFLLQLGMMNLICLIKFIFSIQDYFEYIIKKHETIADNSPVQI